MSDFNAKAVLEFLSDFQNKAQNIKRYEGNPYVEGDSIAEHLSRIARLVLYIAPQLKKEFPDDTYLIENILVTVLIHDDDEIIDGFDIPTAIKNHNSKDDEEIFSFKNNLNTLDKYTQDYLVTYFGSFRKKDTRAAKIAKVLDNIVGNQLVVEQRRGLINPHQAKFAIEYIEKVKGISNTTDNLIFAQIEQIISLRKEMSELQNLSEKEKNLLNIDILNFSLEKEKINIPIEELGNI